MSALAALAPAPSLRSDAQRNHEALLEAAATAFAEGGVDVPAGEIARRAGVAKGTLFRHFPTKRDLLGAVLAHRMRTLRAMIEEVVAESPPGLAAVSALMMRGAAMLAADRSFFDAAMRESANASELTGVKLELVAALDELAAAAQSVGELRDDVNGVDLAMLMMAATNTCAPAGAVGQELWRRYLALMLDGLRPEAARELPLPAPSTLATVEPIESLARAPGAGA
ncbi:MAG TPA: helix-turn-helix domain-containing protein [Solirubrobacteraceae bacterium]